MLLSAYDVLVMRSIVRDQAVTKFGVMHRLVGKLLCLATLEIWRKERFAPFFERPESTSTTSSGLVRYLHGLADEIFKGTQWKIRV